MTDGSTPDWYSDLQTGTGAAAGLGDGVRAALATVTADRAADEMQARAAQDRADLAAAIERRDERARALKNATLAAARERADRRGFADWSLLGWALALSATVLVPWLIGRWLLRGTLTHPTAADVYDVSLRRDETYFIADWLGGVAMLLVLAGVIVLIGRWSYRVGRIVCALIVIVPALFVILPASNSSWADAENQTAALLTTTAFPFGNSYATCGFAEANVPNDDGDVHLWQFHTANAGAPQGQCNRIEIYDGWTYVDTVTLPGDEVIGEAEYQPGWSSNSGLSGFSGTSAADSGVIFTSSSGEMVGFVLAAPDAPWRVPSGGVIDGVEVFTPTLASVTYELGTPTAHVTMLNPATGAVVWGVGCPPGTGYINSFTMNADQTAIELVCYGDAFDYFSVDFAGGVTNI